MFSSVLVVGKPPFTGRSLQQNQTHVQWLSAETESLLLVKMLTCLVARKTLILGTNLRSQPG